MDIWVWGYLDIWIFNEPFICCRCFVELSDVSLIVCSIFWNCVQTHPNVVQMSSKCHKFRPNFVPGSPSPVRLCPSCLRRFGDLKTNTPLEFWNMYFVGFVIFDWFQAPWYFKYDRSDQMTMPARCASKFCARSRSQCPEMFFPQADFFCNSWNDSTLARMSTWRIEAGVWIYLCSHLGTYW